jgi:hypothetical protein
MQDASFGAPARFRPTWQQALARGVYLGGLVAILLVVIGLGMTLVRSVVAERGLPPSWLWMTLVVGPPLVGGALGILVGRRFGTDIDAGGIRLVPGLTHAVEPWSRVVDLRAERWGGRTVVSVYLESGEAVHLRAPYDGELFAADPQFERKLFALSHLWRSHRFGGLAG